ncbi:MAG TPA: DUF58 domain-containing protein [Desertimonas sp.]|nr:DUF58 domain-containing protein [Desertimonas sp.]
MAVQTRPTRQGWIVMACAVATGLLGRVFGVLELFILAAALITAFVAAYFVVLLRRPRVSVRRWVRPEVLTAGDVGRVDLVVRPAGPGFRPSFELIEAVGPDRTARMAVSPMRSGRQKSAGYRIPTERRGVLTIGPLVAVRSDLLGLARSVDVVAGVNEILVAPRAFELPMPELGDGILGRHLLVQSVRLGPGEFHSLREYVPGDEPRTIHWRASARSDDLKVRQYSAEGLRRCTVVLDQQVPSGGAHDEAFERAVVAAASLVHSSDQHGLQTRLATTAGVDLRGPTVSVHTMHHLARVMPDPHPPRPIERDPGEGLGLVFVITPSPQSAAWRTMQEMRDPSLTLLGVFTETPGSVRGKLWVDARSETELLDSWSALVGRGRRPSYLKVNPLAGKQAPIDDPSSAMTGLSA